MTFPAYKFENCKLIRIIDGDTFVASIDVGFNFSTKQRIRLLDCDMPERHEPGGREATAQLWGYLQNAERLVIETVKMDSFGRWLAWVYCGNGGQAVDQLMKDWLSNWQQHQQAVKQAQP